MRIEAGSLTNVRPRTFFVLTFVLSWAVWIPLDASHFGLGPLRIPEGTSMLVRLLGVLMPATAALILTERAGGRPAVGRLLGRLRQVRVGGRWWLAAVVVQPTLLVGAALVANVLSGGRAVPLTLPESAAVLLVNVIFLAIAALGEEIGWRGVALP
ncbi:MAG TPA: hypothetical protein VEY67_00475, partial [Candidatus Dormibacteraeota bacterium]|nr:hypothetical protein [Candidatus Dormibacteraeota bacterium]